jgi:hypothetical protein
MKYIFKTNKNKTYLQNNVASYIFNIHLYKHGFQRRFNFTTKLGQIKLSPNCKKIYINKEFLYK